MINQEIDLKMHNDTVGDKRYSRVKRKQPLITNKRKTEEKKDSQEHKMVYTGIKPARSATPTSLPRQLNKIAKRIQPFFK